MTDVLVPDMGSDDPVDLAEILVKVGDSVKAEDSLVVLESAKASLEVPAPQDGVISALHVAKGQSLNTGDLLLTFEAAGEAASSSPLADEKSEAGPEKAPAPSGKSSTTKSPDNVPLGDNADQEFALPDIGGDAADVIELSVQPGDRVTKDQTLIVLESAKATVEVPADADGVLVKYLVNVGDSVQEGVPYVVLTTESESGKQEPGNEKSEIPASPPEQDSNQGSEKTTSSRPKEDESSKVDTAQKQKVSEPSTSSSGEQGSKGSSGLEVNLSSEVHAGPAVRRLANKLGVVLSRVSSSGPRGRILKEDVHAFVKQEMLKPSTPVQSAGLTPLPSIDFSQYGEVEEVTMTKIQQMSSLNLHRAWVNIPHVTQFDEADITDLEAFRKSLGDEYKKQGIKITMLAFLIKAATLALQAFPRFNASLHTDGKTLIQKKYCHVGFAADTPFGLVVPVIRDADTLSVVQIAEQLGVLSSKARDKKLGPKDMQGGCFSISSLGGIGGTSFTPIVNWPEVAILGVSRAKIEPRWQGQSFEPRLILPLSLSYDHRVIDGADAARFAQYLVNLLSDARRMLL